MPTSKEYSVVVDIGAKGSSGETMGILHVQ